MEDNRQSQQVDIFIVNDKIEEIAPHLNPVDAEIVDAQGMIVLLDFRDMTLWLYIIPINPFYFARILLIRWL